MGTPSIFRKKRCLLSERGREGGPTLRKKVKSKRGGTGKKIPVTSGRPLPLARKPWEGGGGVLKKKGRGGHGRRTSQKNSIKGILARLKTDRKKNRKTPSW